MIISASRRTDIPAFYSKWFFNRIKQGYCTVVNPFNRNQVSYVSLMPEDVDVIVFWTKNAAPIINKLSELDERGFRYYFQYSVNGYPQELEKNIPEYHESINTFKRLSWKLGPEKVIWRYDPIVISNVTNYNYHRNRFEEIAKDLAQDTKRVVISIVDNYRKACSNFRKLAARGVNVEYKAGGAEFASLMKYIAEVAALRGLEIYSCAEIYDLTPFGIFPGKCIDDEYIFKVFSHKVTNLKDTSQREECGCVQSKDIGAYDTCLNGCSYCYAGTLEVAQKNTTMHFDDSPSIIGRYDATPPPKNQTKKKKNESKQTNLF